MAKRKAKEFIATDMNLNMLDIIVSKLNNVADIIRDEYDMDAVGRELFDLYNHTERGLEHIPEREDEFAFTIVCKAIPMDGRHRKVYVYRFRVNTFTDDITCLDEKNLAWTIPMLTDALSVIRDKTIQVAMS